MAGHWGILQLGAIPLTTKDRMLAQCLKGRVAIGGNAAPRAGASMSTRNPPGHPRAVDDRGLVVARPGRHGRAGEDEGCRTETAVLEGRAQRDVDAHPCDESGDALSAVRRPAPELSLPREHVPELVDGPEMTGPA